MKTLTANLLRGAAIAAMMSSLAGCVGSVSPPPTASETTLTSRELHALPAPKMPLVVAVYGYADLTGKFETNNNDTVATYSHAVTQGAASVLVKALQDASAGKWFTVVEREHLNNLVTELQIIREQRQAYKAADGSQLPPLAPMLYAGLLLEGGIIGYDSNTVTGGLGANYLGIGANVQYQEDIVTVYLRAVSSQTGEVLDSVMVKKKIISYGLDANIYKFVAYNKLLQAETGFTANEPGLVALRQAIEKAVVALIVQGTRKNHWHFADAATGQAFLDQWNKDEGPEDPPVAPARSAAAEKAPKSAGEMSP